MALEIFLSLVCGAAAGCVVNLAAMRLAWTPKPHSPWHSARQGPRANWRDRLPIVGWLFWRRQSSGFGPRFWWRPLLVECFCAGGFAAMYWAYLSGRFPWPAGFQPLAGEARILLAVHALLALLMAVASLIDLDEKIIPDAVTFPGTLAALALAAIFPTARLPVTLFPLGVNVPQVAGLLLTHPNEWPAALDGRAGLIIGLACFLGWCVALLPLRWPARRGWRVASALIARRVERDPLTKWLALAALIGSAGIALVWRQGGTSWHSLLTGLVGAAGSGGLVWSMRIVGSWALGREALGFGDVTLMAMIGAFLGWQPCAVVFFVAPLFGLVVGLTQWVLRREPELPYGPYLCLATVVVVVGWADVWERTEAVFSLGLWLVLVLGICLVAMFPTLGLVRLLLGSHPPLKR